MSEPHHKDILTPGDLALIVKVLDPSDPTGKPARVAQSVPVAGPSIIKGYAERKNQMTTETTDLREMGLTQNQYETLQLLKSGSRIHYYGRSGIRRIVPQGLAITAAEFKALTPLVKREGEDWVYATPGENERLAAEFQAKQAAEARAREERDRKRWEEFADKAARRITGISTPEIREAIAEVIREYNRMEYSDEGRPTPAEGE